VDAANSNANEVKKIMGRMYSILMDGISISAADDLLRISSSSTDVTVLHSVTVTQDASETSEQLPFQIMRASTDGTGTSTTPRPLSDGDPAFGGTAVTALTVDTTPGNILHREGVNVLNGFYWKPTPEERIVIPPSGRLVVRLDAAPAAALTMSLIAIIEEIG
jgi:hypothetical protein